MNNMQQLLKQAKKMQDDMAKAQEEMEKIEVSGSAGSGSVSFTINLKGKVRKVSIAEDLMKPEEKEILEDLIVAAYNDAKKKADSTSESMMASITGNMPKIPGLF